MTIIVQFTNGKLGYLYEEKKSLYTNKAKWDET